MANRKPTTKKMSERAYWLANRDLLDQLGISARNRELVMRVYGLDGFEMQMLRQAGRPYGITPERVRQILNESRAKANRRIEFMKRFHIEELELTPSVHAALLAAKISNFYALTQRKGIQLLELPNFGYEALQSIRRQLREHPDGPFFLRDEIG